MVIGKRKAGSGKRRLERFVTALRKKIERHPRRPRLIRTVRGFGYRFEGGRQGDGSVTLHPHP